MPLARNVIVVWIKNAAAIGAFVSLASVAIVPAASAVTPTASSTYNLQLSHRPVVINTDGSVSVVGWLSCTSDLYTFEYSVDVRQSDVQGSAFLSGASLPCDGTRHRFRIAVTPYEGAFSRGPADISIYIGLYDAANGADLAANDAVSTRLR